MSIRSSWLLWLSCVGASACTENSGFGGEGGSGWDASESGEGSSGATSGEAGEESDTRGDVGDEGGPIGSCSPVLLSDPLVAEQVRMMLGLAPGAPIDAEDIEYLYYLDLQLPGGNSLSGLECATNLETLRLDGPTPESLEPLAELPHLEYFEVANGRLSVGPQTMPLGEMVALRYLFINGGVVGTRFWLDIGASGSLRSLTVVGSEMDADPPFSGPETLIDLAIEHTGLESISKIGSLESLSDLFVRDTPLVDLGGLTGLTSLSRVTVVESQVRSLPRLDDAPLTSLTLRSNPLQDLGGVAGHVGLVELNIEETEVGTLVALPALGSLWAADSKLSDLSAASACPSLLYADLSRTPVSDLSPLAGHPSLRRLVVNEATQLDATTLSDVPALEVLEIENSGVTALPPGLPVSTLLASGNQIADLEPLMSWSWPDRWDLSDNAVVDPSPLLGLSTPAIQSCAVIDLTGNPLAASSAQAVLDQVCTQELVWVYTDIRGVYCETTCPVPP